MIDYNIYGMSTINLYNFKYRQHLENVGDEKLTVGSCTVSSTEEINEASLSSLIKQSSCELEIDALASDILNYKDVEQKLDLNPGINAIWKEEKARRAHEGLPERDSQLMNPKSPDRSQAAKSKTDSEIYQENRFLTRLQELSQKVSQFLNIIYNI